MQCTAHSSRTGKPCNCQAIAGANVCRNHGGAAPQVKEAARLRLLSLVDPALGVLAHALKQTDKQLPAALSAARDVLDRAGLKEPDKVDLNVDGPVRFVLERIGEKAKE